MKQKLSGKDQFEEINFYYCGMEFPEKIKLFCCPGYRKG
jgi:hypothetical protein